MYTYSFFRHSISIVIFFSNWTDFRQLSLATTLNAGVTNLTYFWIKDPVTCGIFKAESIVFMWASPMPASIKAKIKIKQLGVFYTS